MPNYKVLALDIDGTLLTGDGQLTGTVKNAVRRAADAGVTVVLTTGRALHHTEYIYDDLNLDGPLVLLNGAEVWKRPGELLQRHYLIPEHRARLLALALEHGAWYWLTTVDGPFSKETWSDDLLNRDWMKLGMRHSDPRVLQRIAAVIGEWDAYEVTSSHPTNIEVGPKGVTKATGLSAVCSELGLSLHDVLAIGDSPNDVAMLRSVGFGVAMGNADPAVKRLADAVTASNQDDGVARAIDEYLFGCRA